MGTLSFPLETGVDAGEISGTGVGLGSDMGTDKTKGAEGSDAFPWFEIRVDGFGVPSVSAAPKKEC